MMRKYGMLALLLSIGVTFIVKSIFLFSRYEYEQLLYVVLATIWAIWVTASVFKDWDLPAPFGFQNGENQGFRISYDILVVGIFFFFVFRA